MKKLILISALALTGSFAGAADMFPVTGGADGTSRTMGEAVADGMSIAQTECAPQTPMQVSDWYYKFLIPTRSWSATAQFQCATSTATSEVNRCTDALDPSACAAIPGCQWTSGYNMGCFPGH